MFSLAILSCGGVYGDDTENSPIQPDDPRITHFIIDRPAECITFEENKEYVQPQWVFDCVNSKKLLPVSEYQPGKKLPPHISPFYEYTGEGEIQTKLKTPKSQHNVPQLEIKQDKPVEDENNDLREMLISKNKKRVLNRIREEKLKKKKVVKK